jgi:ubiquinone/menaquinone biosynthesis C-methylase UbiE
MFSKSARFYDAVYAVADKDYKIEAEKAHQIIQQKKRSSGNTLLEVACGTGLHASIFRKYYLVEGLDLDPEMLTVASHKYPAITFH